MAKKSEKPDKSKEPVTTETTANIEENKQETVETENISRSDESNNSNNNHQQTAPSISDKISAATDRGVALAKELFGKAKHYSNEAVELTRLKIDIYNLKSDRDRIYKNMGARLWQLNKEDKFRGIKSQFTDEFDLLNSLEEKISAKEDELKDIKF